MKATSFQRGGPKWGISFTYISESAHLVHTVDFSVVAISPVVAAAVVDLVAAAFFFFFAWAAAVVAVLFLVASILETETAVAAAFHTPVATLIVVAVGPSTGTGVEGLASSVPFHDFSLPIVGLTEQFRC